MTGLINLISEYSSRLAILPILSVMNIIITIIIYKIDPRRIVKYIPSLVIGAISLLVGIYSISIFTSTRGLNTAWIAVFLATTALVGICTSLVIDLYASLRKDLTSGRDIKQTKGEFEFKARRRRNKGRKNES